MTGRGRTGARRRVLIASLAGLSLPTVLAAGPALAQEPLGNVSMGEDLAKAVCVECHAIEPGERADGFAGAPAFQEVADQPAATALSLRVFLRSPHMTMPNFALTDDQIDNLIAYIHSLR